MSMTETIFFNEGNSEFALLQFNDRQLVIKIEVRTPNSKLRKAHTEHCTSPLTREKAIKKAKEIYANPLY